MHPRCCRCFRLLYCPPTTWPQSSRIVVQHTPRAPTGPDHLGLLFRVRGSRTSQPRVWHSRWWRADRTSQVLPITPTPPHTPTHTIRTILRRDGPDHLGLCRGPPPEHQDGRDHPRGCCGRRRRDLLRLPDHLWRLRAAQRRTALGRSVPHPRNPNSSCHPGCSVWAGVLTLSSG